MQMLSTLASLVVSMEDLIMNRPTVGLVYVGLSLSAFSTVNDLTVNSVKI